MTSLPKNKNLLVSEPYFDADDDTESLPDVSSDLMSAIHRVKSGIENSDLDYDDYADESEQESGNYSRKESDTLLSPKGVSVLAYNILEAALSLVKNYIEENKNIFFIIIVVLIVISVLILMNFIIGLCTLLSLTKK